MPFKKTIITLILFVALCSWGWFSLLPTLAQNKIESYLTDAGYKPRAIETILVKPPYIIAQNIQMDEHGFNTIGLLGARMDGFSIAEIRLDNVETSSTVETIGAIIRLALSLQKKLPGGALYIDKMISDFATPYGDLRLETTIDLAAADGAGNRTVATVIKARQYQLSFDTRWNGIIGPDGTMKLDGEIMDGRLNIGPARLARLSGWLSWQSKDETMPEVAGQIDAGSGTLFAMPLSNINLTLSSADDAIDLMFRTGLSGIENVRLALDSRFTQLNSTFDGVLDIPDSKAFLDYIQTLHDKAAPEKLNAIGPLRISMDYREERRFEGGPLPFALKAISNDKEILDGNILFYPDTQELRGSAQTNEDLAIALQRYFTIAEDKRSGGSLRLDGHIQKLLENKETE